MDARSLDLTDARGKRWVGMHRTDIIDLAELFEALAVQRNPDGWTDRLPEDYELVELMRRN